MQSKAAPPIQTTVVGSYPIPDWLIASPSQQALRDATAVVLKTQEMAGIDVVADGELYRFDINHPETNGMIDFFVRPLAGIRTDLGLKDKEAFQKAVGMQFRSEPAGIVEGPVEEGTLDLVTPLKRARALTHSRLKFTLTGPHMLTRTLQDNHFPDPARLCQNLADILAGQVARLDADIVQIDEANITGHPEDAAWAADGINRVLREVKAEKAVHLCFGNYGGQTIQAGTWDQLIDFMNRLEADHFVLEMSRRGPEELAKLNGLDHRFGIGLGVIDIKTTLVETPSQVAAHIEKAHHALGHGTIQYVHPDCGFWMLPRSVADRKLRALVEGRDLYLKAGA